MGGGQFARRRTKSAARPHMRFDLLFARQLMSSIKSALDPQPFGDGPTLHSRCQTRRAQLGGDGNCRVPHPKEIAKRFGGARRNRTDDLMLAKHALSQLSYGPDGRERVRASHSGAALMAFSPSIGPPDRLIALRANGSKWWAWEDLNFRPHAYQARALTN